MNGCSQVRWRSIWSVSMQSNQTDGFLSSVTAVNSGDGVFQASLQSVQMTESFKRLCSQIRWRGLSRVIAVNSDDGVFQEPLQSIQMTRYLKRHCSQFRWRGLPSVIAVNSDDGVFQVSLQSIQETKPFKCHCSQLRRQIFFLSVIAKGAFRLRQSTIWLTDQSCIQIYFFPCTYYPHVELKWQITFTVN